MNNKLRKWIVGTTLVTSIFSVSTISTFGNQEVHLVSNGDTLWKISQKYNITMNDIYRLNPKYNNDSTLFVGDKVNISSSQSHVVVKGDTPWKISQAYKVDLNQLLRINGLSSNSEIYPGQRILIPSSTNNNNGWSYTVVRNDTPWTISQKFSVSFSNLLAMNGLKEGDHIYVGQKILVPNETVKKPVQNTLPTANKKSFITHTVVRGDDLWNISIKYGIPFHELLQVNGLRDNHVINIGDKLTVPVYEIAIKETPGPQYGELLDWWTEAQYVLPIGKVFDVVDFNTGKKWTMKRTIGANHADVEPLTSRDAAIMKEVWGGSYSWNRRPVIVEIDNRRLAASASSMPHDIQYINNNNFSGHADLYFGNSTRHVDGKADSLHQSNIEIAAGIKK
ncbi:LysM peptidoglycan-binding domain-containing protein [Alkaliphilus peptidifermentans]|uniref:LysM repeat-containing protein n=1 Tax=Alkaliphilus peptidifermentans DSM 18978 TaxID=1120976 RepID=A0A1G5GD43_9FIRM|nr:LysM peptidoglycan-binding domain-containing protein [Alkaliphilus peptidifermentans]SCY48628.1 LysM repeat-containing protein [Alkaliphilus peptidifermentans DSM 18978]